VATNPVEVTLRWGEAQQFAAALPGRPAVPVDADGAVAVSPVELLLIAAASCTASDVVLILQKQRVALRGLEVRVRGTRREEQPRRYTALHFVFTVTGDGADDAKARRAVDLSLEKYCSVVASLAPDIRISYDVALR
jgi:putative redox protein